MKIIGSYLSPYVRKVLACLEAKGLRYEIDPIVPFYGSDAFTRLSPLRRIPVLIDGDVVLADSTVICEYLNEQYPAPNLMPAAPADRGRARWLEELADSRLGDLIIWRLYNERVIKRFVWKQPIDEAAVSRALEVDIPEALDYLETQVPAAGYLFATLSVADIAIASFFRNATFAGFDIDAARWPRLHRFVYDVLDAAPLQNLRRYEELSMSTPITLQREALAAAGAPVSQESVGETEPRRH